MLKYQRKCVGEIRLFHDLDNLKQTCIRLELDLVGECAFRGAFSQSLNWTLAVGVVCSSFTIWFVDVLLARVVQIAVVELVCDLGVTLARAEHVEVASGASIIFIAATRRLEALSIGISFIEAKDLKDAGRFLTLVQEVAQEIVVGLLTFDELTFLEIVDQDVQHLQACLRKIQLIAICSSNSILKLPLLEIDHPRLALAGSLRDRWRR